MKDKRILCIPESGMEFIDWIQKTFPDKGKYKDWLTDICTDYRLSVKDLAKMSKMPQSCIETILREGYNADNPSIAFNISQSLKKHVEGLRKKPTGVGASSDEDWDLFEYDKLLGVKESTNRAALCMDGCHLYLPQLLMLSSPVVPVTDDVYEAAAKYDFLPDGQRNFVLENLGVLSRLTDEDMNIMELFRSMPKTDAELVLEEIKHPVLRMRDIFKDGDELETALMCLELAGSSQNKRIWKKNNYTDEKANKTKEIEASSKRKSEIEDERRLVMIKNQAEKYKKTCVVGVSPINRGNDKNDRAEDERAATEWMMACEGSLKSRSLKYMYMFDVSQTFDSTCDFIRMMQFINDADKWRNINNNFNRMISYTAREWYFLGMFKLTSLCDFDDLKTGSRAQAIIKYMERWK